MLLREDLADLMPMVNEANAISQELDKKVNKQSYIIINGLLSSHHQEVDSPPTNTLPTV